MLQNRDSRKINTVIDDRRDLRVGMKQVPHTVAREKSESRWNR